MDKKQELSQSNGKILHIERESPTKLTYELSSGAIRTIRVHRTFADFIMEAWERFLTIPQENDSLGG